LQQVQTDVNRAGELLWENGLYSGDRPLIDSGMRVIHAKKMFDAIAQLIRDGRAEQFLFSIKKDIDYEH
jgi:aminoglycoside 3-N-acetyltransferase